MRQGKKAKRRLKARVRDYDESNLSDPRHAANGMKFHKPGSAKKK